ncbi:hypothetical protein [Streptomyces canus]|uniref:hypothetical protein n=1 Tax=Streptomyces canus TaxID=58343 RepID=UPI003CF9F6DE
MVARPGLNGDHRDRCGRHSGSGHGAYELPAVVAYGAAGSCADGGEGGDGTADVEPEVALAPYGLRAMRRRWGPWRLQAAIDDSRLAWLAVVSVVFVLGE